MAALAKSPKFQPLDALGNPLPNYALFSYDAGTSTPKVTYKDKAGTPNTNPVILDAAGQADIWLQGAYKLVLRPPVLNPDQTPLWTVDNIEEYNQLDWTGLTATITMLNATDTSTKILYDDYDLVLTDRGKTLLCDTTSTAFYVQLNQATAAKNGFIISIKKISISANILTVKPYAGQTIEGLSTLLINNKDEAITLICDGSNWRILQDTVKVEIYPIITNNTILSLVAFPSRYLFRVQPSSSDITITLPALANTGNGFELIFKKVGASSHTVIITPYGTENIDDINISAYLHANGESITLLSTTTSWYKTSDSIGITNEPLGSIVIRTDNTPDILPAYLLADGRAISRTAYAEYFALVGTTYGIGDGATTFNIPHIRDRALIGAGGTYALGTQIGAATHTLTIAEMPIHNHGYTTYRDVVNGAGAYYGHLRDETPPYNINTGNAGSGAAHNNMQPSLALTFLVKVK